MIKGFNFNLEYILYDLSYSNMIMLSATLPSYNEDKTDNESKEEHIIRADDPNNKQKVKDFFNKVNNG